MTNETRDPQFSHYVDEQAEALSRGEPSFRLGVVAPLAALISVHDALTTLDPGFLARVFKRLAV